MGRWVWMTGLLLACGGDDDVGPTPDGGVPDAGALPYEVPEGCHPLAAEHDCGLPFPSDFFLVDDASLPTGKRVEIHPNASFPFAGDPADLFALHDFDGASLAAPMICTFGVPIDDAPLVAVFDDLDRSTEDSSPTLLIEADTGERVPHFAETDPITIDDRRRAFFLRPGVRLEPETRYVVAIRDLTQPDGTPVPPPEGFRRIRDGEAGDHPALAPMAERFETEVFGVLEAEGIAREELLLAWDFTTGSELNVMADLVAIRDDVTDRLAEEPPAVRITEVITDPEALGELADDVRARVEVDLEVPLYLTNDNPGMGRLQAALGGDVRATFPVTILVPHAADEWTEPQRVMHFGHGFFGTRGEVLRSFQPAFANERDFVVAGLDWWGMMDRDQVAIVNTFAADPLDASELLSFIDRVHQGMANQMALDAALRTTLTELPELQLEDGRPLWDTENVYFYGISQGHILGGTYAALGQSERVVLGVGGANFSLIMFRSRSFTPFRVILDVTAQDRLDQQKFGVLLQYTFDRIDPLTYAPFVLERPLDGAPERRVLMQTGIADAEVAATAAHLHARALGLPLAEPAAREVWGVETTTLPADSAWVEYDFGVAPFLLANAPEPNDVHEGVRRTDSSQEQIDRFFRPEGQVEQVCDDTCDPN